MNRDAPQTRALLKVSGIRTMGGGQIGTKGLYAEIRAMLSVVALVRKRHDPNRGKWCDALTTTAECPSCRAIARLDKASKGSHE